MAKSTKKTEPAAAAKKPAAPRAKAAPRRAKAAAPAAGIEQSAGKGAASEPTDDEIALRAWEIYQRRGASHGQAMNDWLEAKRQLLAEREIAK